MAFVANHGQLGNPSVRFYGSSGPLQVGFTDGAVLYNLLPPAHSEGASGALLRLSFAAPRSVPPEGRGLLPSPSHFFLGDNPSQWRTGVPSYAEVVYPELYPGIDLVYRTDRGSGLKYDFVVRPGADPSAISVRLEGAEDLLIAEDELRIRTPLGTLRDVIPRSYQTSGDPVRCTFRGPAPSTWGFACEGRDPLSTLVIDPFVFSTFLGGSGIDGDPDKGFAFALDATGDATFAAHTYSADFPTTPGAYDTTLENLSDVVVFRLNAAGTGLLFSTFLGGDSSDFCFGVALDAGGNVYLTGSTYSTNFPTTPGAYDTTNDAGEAFVAKVRSDGAALLFSTLFGGTAAGEIGWGIAVDGAGAAYVAGQTSSSNFPTTAGALDTTFAAGGSEGFVTKVRADGGALTYSTFLGSAGQDYALAIAVDSGGNAYATGVALSGFPSTAGSYDPSFNGGRDAYVVKLNPSGSALVYGTFLGGSLSDQGAGLFLDPSGAVYVTGTTGSNNFPTTAGAFDRTFAGGGNDDGFVSKLDAAGATLGYATYLGDTGIDEPRAITADGSGQAYVTGMTMSSTFPTTNGAIDVSLDGVDAFLVGFAANGSAVVYGTFLGGASADYGYSIAASPSGVYVSGVTASSDFPTTAGSFDTTYSGGSTDGFFAKLDVLSVPLTLTSSPSGRWVSVDGTSSRTPYTYYCAFGSSADLDVLDPQYIVDVRWVFDAWEDGGPKARTVSCDQARSFEAQFHDEFQAIVGSNPFGLPLFIDFVRYDTQAYVWWRNGTTHWVEALPSAVPSPGTTLFWLDWSDGGARNHSVVAAAPWNLVATYGNPEYLLTIDTSPTGLEFFVDGARHQSALTQWYDAGTVLTLNATWRQGSTDTWDQFRAWSDGNASANRTFAVAGPGTLVASYDRYFRVVVGTDPPGLEMWVDGMRITSSLAFVWREGTVHSLVVLSPQNETANSRLAFAAWSNGGAQSQDVNATGPMTLTARFVGQYRVDVDTTPRSFEVLVDGVPYPAPYTVWWNASDPHVIGVTSPYLETPDVRWRWATWDDGGGLNHTVNVDAPTTFLAVMVAEYRVIVRTDPADLDVLVDGLSYRDRADLWWEQGTSHTLEAPEYQNATPTTRYVFLFWSNTGPRSQTLSVSNPEAFIAHYTEQALALEACTVTPATATLRPGEERVFVAHGWNGTVELPTVNVTWRVDGTIGTVNASGRFTAKTVGQGQVTASVAYRGITKECAADVSVQPADGGPAGILPMWLLLALVVGVAIAVLVAVLLRRRRRVNRDDYPAGPSGDRRSQR